MQVFCSCCSCSRREPEAATFPLCDNPSSKTGSFIIFFFQFWACTQECSGYSQLCAYGHSLWCLGARTQIFHFAEPVHWPF